MQPFTAQRKKVFLKYRPLHSPMTPEPSSAGFPRTGIPIRTRAAVAVSVVFFVPFRLSLLVSQSLL